MVVTPPPGLGCSVIPRPVSEFDSTQYVLIGAVAEVVGPIQYQYARRKTKGKALGLRIKVTDRMYSPEPTSDYVEVFPFRLTGSCDLIPWESDKLTQHFSPSSEVRIIAHKASLVAKGSTADVLPLEITSHRVRSSLVRNDLDGGLRSTADSIYDYQGYTIPQKLVGKELVFEANYHLPDFELQKDLLRLMKAPKTDRVKILKRLAYFPINRFFAFPQIAERYIQDIDTLGQLYDIWYERVEPMEPRPLFQHQP